MLVGVALQGRRPVVLLGHSASCQVVAHAAALAPTVVHALVLVGPTTDPGAPTWPGLARRWIATAAHETPRQVPCLLRWYRETGVGAALRTMESARHDDIRLPVRLTRRPVLVLRGWHDRICPPAWTRELAGAGPPGSRALTLPSGGHMVPLTHPAPLAAAVTDFLRHEVPGT